MTSFDDYTDLSSLGGNGEEIPGGVLQADTSGFRQIPPGSYFNSNRSVKGRTIRNGEHTGHMEFEISFGDKGLTDLTTGKQLSTKYLTKKVSTVPFPLKDFETGQPLLNSNGTPKQSTSVASYLQALGINTDNLNFSQLQEKLTESQTIPCTVVIGWQDKSVKDDSSPTGWKGGKLKTKAFQVAGDKDNPVYAETVTIEGVVYNAKAVVSYFKKAA